MAYMQELFFREQMRRRQGRQAADEKESPDPMTRLFGTAMPNTIPESSAWHRA